MEDIQIIYKDERVVAINKPSKLLVHKTNIDHYETTTAMKLLRNKLKKWVYPLHRLDKATSGVLLFALDKESARIMGNLFADQKLEKIYFAVARGFTINEGTINYPLKKLSHNKKLLVKDDEIIQKDAITHFKLLSKKEIEVSVGRYNQARYSFLKLEPETGRNHQIRRHLKHIYHPIIGDTTYGDGKHNKFFREYFDCHRLLLHSASIVYQNPFTNQKQEIKAELDEDFQKIATHFSLTNNDNFYF